MQKIYDILLDYKILHLANKFPFFFQEDWDLIRSNAIKLRHSNIYLKQITKMSRHFQGFLFYKLLGLLQKLPIGWSISLFNNFEVWHIDRKSVV